jgi:hypothetical protein
MEKYPTNKRQTSRTSKVLPESLDFSMTSDTIFVTLLIPVMGSIVCNSSTKPLNSQPRALEVIESCSNRGSRATGKDIERGVTEAVTAAVAAVVAVAAAVAVAVAAVPFKAAPMAPKGIRALR